MKQLRTETWRREQQLLTDKFCGLDFNLYDVDFNKVQDSFKAEFYSQGVMEGIRCILEKIIMDQTGFMSRYEELHHWITPTHRIGGITSFGQVMEASIRQLEDFVVLKVPDRGANREIAHEYIVASYGTNMLRGIVPNFAYTFGTFDCSTPVIGTFGDVLSWCMYDSPTRYLVSENITPSISVADLSRQCTTDEFLEMYLQVLYALRTAYKKIRFTHYDLHAGNVLLRSIDADRFAIPYQLEDNSQGYLITDKIATLIDFGSSYIEHDGRSYGNHTLTPFGVLPDQPFPLYDAYKLLLMSLSVMKNSSNPTFDTISQIVGYFNDENINIILDDQESSYYALSVEANEILSLDGLIAYIRKLFNPSFITKDQPNVPILQCSSCDDVQDYINQWTSSSRMEKRSLVDIADLVSQNVPVEIPTDIQQRYDQEFQQQATDVQMLLGKVLPWYVTGDILTDAEKLQREAEKLAIILDMYADLLTLVEAGEYLGVTIDKQQLESIQKQLGEIQRKYALNIDQVNDFMDVDPEQADDWVHDRAPIAWLFTDFVVIYLTLRRLLLR